MVEGATSIRLLCTQNSTASTVRPSVTLARASILARAKSLESEALLISIGCTYAEQKVTDPCLTTLLSDIIFSWAAGSDTSDALRHSLTGTSETPPLVPDGRATEPQSSLQLHPYEASSAAQKFIL
jgi:hypothetical protein